MIFGGDAMFTWTADFWLVQQVLWGITVGAGLVLAGCLWMWRR
jgi:hypothetical protein